MTEQNSLGTETPTTFETLLLPILEELQRLIDQYNADAGSNKLFCFDFVSITTRLLL